MILPLLAFACTAPSAAPQSAADGTETGDPEGSTIVDRGTVGDGDDDAGAPVPVCSEEGRYTAMDMFVVDRKNEAQVWERWVSKKLYTHDEAVAYCASLKLGRQTVWRLPTVQELNTLKLHPAGIGGGTNSCFPAIDQTAFPQTPTGEFWTSTLRPAGDAMYVGFDDGRNHASTIDTPMNVRCVTDP